MRTGTPTGVEVTADQFPDEEFELLAGVKDAARLLEGRAVDTFRSDRLRDTGR